MENPDAPSPATLVLTVIAATALGTPMFLYLWETLNGVLTGHGSARRIALSLPVLALFVALLWALARVVRRLDAGIRAPSDHPRPRR